MVRASCMVVMSVLSVDVAWKLKVLDSCVFVLGLGDLGVILDSF